MSLALDADRLSELCERVEQGDAEAVVRHELKEDVLSRSKKVILVRGEEKRSRRTRTPREAVKQRLSVRLFWPARQRQETRKREQKVDTKAWPRNPGHFHSTWCTGASPMDHGRARLAG